MGIIIGNFGFLGLTYDILYHIDIHRASKECLVAETGQLLRKYTCLIHFVPYGYSLIFYVSLLPNIALAMLDVWEGESFI